jgi:carbon-monoxide dehydrogenase large subunit
MQVEQIQKDKISLIGKTVLKKEDKEVLLGRATYAADINFPDMLYVGILRSPYAHAKIIKIDLTKALKMPGVVFGINGQDLLKLDFVKPLPPFPFQSIDPFKRRNPSIKFFNHYCLATDKVRFVGEPIAAIAATSPEIAEDALEEIETEFELLQPVTDVQTALSPNAPLLYEEWGDNIALRFHVLGGNIEESFKEADLIIEEEIRMSRCTGTPLENRSVVAKYDADKKNLIVWDTTQIPHIIALLIKKALKIPELKVRVIQPRIGGGFGQKWGLYPEEVLIPLISILTGKPVKWTESRTEHMHAISHARDQIHKIRVGVKKDGKILGIEDKILADIGAAYYQGGHASIVTTAFFVPGAYKIQNYKAEVLGIVTNKAPFGAHRGFGKSEAAFVIERLIDIIAYRLSIDPNEVRFKNFIKPEEFPYISVTGNRYDSGNYKTALELAMEIGKYWWWRKRQAELRSQGKYIGIGTALVIEPSSSTRMGSYNAGYYSVHIRIDPDVTVNVFLSGGEEGQGHKTSTAQIIAEELQIPFEKVNVFEGDSLLCPIGSGSYSSRFSVVGTSAIIMACRALKEKILGIASKALQQPKDDLELIYGKVISKRDGSSITLEEIAQIAYYEIYRLPENFEPGLEILYHYRDPNIDFYPDEFGRVKMFSSVPYDAEMTVVEVNPETGFIKILEFVSVHDCGKMLNPLIVERQHLGALAHGFGIALSEEIIYDTNGQLLSNNFLNYLIPTSQEIPFVKIHHIETPNPFTPGGFKGAGETGTVGPPASIANAVEDALRPFGVKIRKVPLTPIYIRQLIKETMNKTV